jgi:tRNA (cytidine/uridine-2'-O-)-methyltransferase
LVKPFGFELNDKRLKRAGLDYWKHVTLNIYDNIQEFYLKNKGANMVYLSSLANKNYTTIKFQDNMFFLFGKESIGLSKELTTKNLDKLYKIPIQSKHVRSLNLANAVSIVVYEALRNLK